MQIKPNIRWAAVFLMVFTSCQLVGEQHSPVEGLWLFNTDSNSLYDEDFELTFFADGTSEGIGFLRDPDTGEHLGITFASIDTYHIAGDRIQFRAGLETPSRHLESPLPLDSLKYIRNYMAPPRNRDRWEMRYIVSGDQLVLDRICPPNANCAPNPTYTRIGEPIKRLQ
ncbi:MAG: hypothetical protein KTR29_12320 [Rhodothermaceae bacterium]|nr:hypothetical protein [Rhodothermaceae bacterium]